MTKRDDPTVEFPPMPLEATDIMRYIPHRYPFLLIDRVVDLREKFIAATKCVTANEPYFPGHFPGRPIVPGVLQLEMIAQTGAVLEGVHPDRAGKLLVLAGIDEARFRRMVVPGDVLRIEVEELFRRKSLGRVHGKVLVEGQVACEAVVTFAITEMSPAQVALSR